MCQSGVRSRLSGCKATCLWLSLWISDSEFSITSWYPDSLIFIYYFPVLIHLISYHYFFLFPIFFPLIFYHYFTIFVSFLSFQRTISQIYLSSLSLYNFGFIFDVRELAPSLLADIALFQSIVGKKARSLLIFIFAILLYKNLHLSKLLYKIFSIIL